MFHNEFKYLDYTVREEHIRITRKYLSQLFINRGFRGSFSDLIVYSKPMDEESLRQWTTCQFDEAGDVFQWDINKFNLTNDETIISCVEKVDTKFFCKSEGLGQKEMFGDGYGTSPFFCI